MDPAEVIIPNEDYSAQVRARHLRRADNKKIPLLLGQDKDLRCRLMAVIERTESAINHDMLRGNCKGRRRKEYVAQAVINFMRNELAEKEPTSGD